MRKTALKWAVIAFGAVAGGAGARRLLPQYRQLRGLARGLQEGGRCARHLGARHRRSLAVMTFDPAIIRRDHGQAVFQQTFLQFADRMVGGARIPNGLAKIKQHAALFAEVEKKYGVPAPVLTAFWGLESDFGANFGNYKILSALATLAYDCRRPDFFRQQLFDALRIIERGDQTRRRA